MSAGELGRGAAVVGTETAELAGGRTPDELIPAHPAAISSPNTAKNGHQILEVMTKHNASTLGFSRCYEGNIGRTVVGAPIHVSSMRTPTLFEWVDPNGAQPLPQIVDLIRCPINRFTLPQLCKFCP